MCLPSWKWTEKAQDLSQGWVITVLFNSSWSVRGQQTAAMCIGSLTCQMRILALWTSYIALMGQSWCDVEQKKADLSLGSHDGVKQVCEAGVSGWPFFLRFTKQNNCKLRHVCWILRLFFLTVLQSWWGWMNLTTPFESLYGLMGVYWCWETHIDFLPVQPEHLYSVNTAGSLQLVSLPSKHPVFFLPTLDFIWFWSWSCNASRSLSVYCLSQSVINPCQMWLSKGFRVGHQKRDKEGHIDCLHHLDTNT